MFMQGRPRASCDVFADMKCSAICLLVTLFVSLVACSSDDEAGTKDPATSCNDLCTSAGFGDGRADVQPNEINCFCTGGSGTISATACTDMCSSIGKSKSEPFGSGAGQTANACQCS